MRAGGRRLGRGGAKSRHHNSEAALDAEITARLDLSLVPDIDLFEICQPGSVQASWGGPFNVTYQKKSDQRFMQESYQQGTAAATATGAATRAGPGPGLLGQGGAVFHPLKFVYYTECGTTHPLTTHSPPRDPYSCCCADQVVRFDEEGTLAALSAASNSTCFFVGRRKEKKVDADPASYMDGLGNWRECGVPGFSLTWPRDTHVMVDS